MRIVLLVNESSGSGTDGDALHRALASEGAEVLRLPMEGLAHAARHEPDRLVVASGDGCVAAADPGRFEVVVA